MGEDYDKGTAFLPQLLSAAQAAQAVFEVIRSSIAAKGGVPVKKGKLIVATVQGDIHDIGKNIVKTVLGNYGYEVLDLGRDVPPDHRFYFVTVAFLINAAFINVKIVFILFRSPYDQIGQAPADTVGQNIRIDPYPGFISLAFRIKPWRSLILSKGYKAF